MSKKSILKIIVLILIILHILYLTFFWRYIIFETLSFKENGKTYYVRQSLHKYQVTEMSDDFIPKELSYKLQKLDYIDTIKKGRNTNISTRYRVFSIIQLIIIIGIIIYIKKPEENEIHYIKNYKL
ncbi:MAG: hypothetical protein J6M60_01860 [Clostridia bacterium]|nr:hypothetical protein [Clostridia bacterium]